MIYRLLKKGLLLSLLLGCAVYLAAQLSPRPPALSTPRAAENPATSNEVSFQQDVEYGVQGGEKLLLDIYQPADSGSKPRPAVVLIHGGGWTSFDKSTMRGMGEFLARFGFVAFAVDYRLFKDGENRWPAQLDDVQRAVRWVRANAGTYGVNSERV